MKFNFDKPICRKGSNCEKWDVLDTTYHNKNAIPLWVADMDFEVPEEVRKNIEKRLEHEIFGYTFVPDSYYNAVISWMKRIHNWDIKKEWIVFTPGVVPGLSFIIHSLTTPDDEIIVQTPVYHQFFDIIEKNNCKVVENPLINNEGYYTMDFEDLEKKITSRTKMIILCSPHNPVGRVWTKEELTKVGEIALKHNIFVVCDEIHSDLIMSGNEHMVFSKLSKDMENISMICTSPNKTFNIAGLQTANIIIPNDKIRKYVYKSLKKFHITEPTIFGAIAQETVYKYGEEWYRELLKYIEENMDFVIHFINTRIPKLKTVKPEGTYLMWVNFSALNIPPKELSEKLISDAGLVLNSGILFGKQGEDYQRINIATSRSILKEGLERLEKFINSL